MSHDQGERPAHGGQARTPLTAAEDAAVAALIDRAVSAVVELGRRRRAEQIERLLREIDGEVEGG